MNEFFSSFFFKFKSYVTPEISDPEIAEKAAKDQERALQKEEERKNAVQNALEKLRKVFFAYSFIFYFFGGVKSINLSL